MPWSVTSGAVVCARDIRGLTCVVCEADDLFERHDEVAMYRCRRVYGGLGRILDKKIL